MAGLLLAIGAAAALRWPDDADQRRMDAQAALDARNFPAAIVSYQEELRRDPASAYRWADLGEAFFAAGEVATARECFAQALQLGPHILPVWVRDANFHYQVGEPLQALTASAHVLTTVPDYDAILFSYFDRLVPDPNQVLGQIGSNKRASMSYFQHLIDSENVVSAGTAWSFLLSKKFVDDHLAGAYVDFLLGHRLYDNAVRSWAAYVGPRGRDYPNQNLLFNGSYENEPATARFDWRILPSDKVDTVRDRTDSRDGNWAMHITFHGDENVAYDNVMQTARVHVGEYQLTAWMRTSDITTNEGIRFRVFDPENTPRLNYTSEPITGTHDWMALKETIRIPEQTNIVTVEVLRIPSTKFDSKISGSAWIDEVSLRRIN